MSRCCFGFEFRCISWFVLTTSVHARVYSCVSTQAHFMWHQDNLKIRNNFFFVHFRVFVCVVFSPSIFFAKFIFPFSACIFGDDNRLVIDLICEKNANLALLDFRKIKWMGSEWSLLLPFWHNFFAAVYASLANQLTRFWCLEKKWMSSRLQSN